MKSFLLAIGLITLAGLTANAAPKVESAQQRICASFQAKEDLECSHIMCDDDIANGTYKNLDECTRAEDYQEAAQAGCEGQETTVDKLAKIFNRTHPKFQIKCES